MSLHTFYVILYVVAITVLVVSAWVSPLTWRLFAVAFICVDLVQLIVLIKQN